MNLPKFSNQKASSLIKEIFKADYPEKFIAEIPAQTLYLAIRQTSLSDNVELLEIASPEQLQTFLDLDIWDEDRFSENKFWEWLELPEACNDPKILKRILASMDLKLVALLIARHTAIHIAEEPTDESPGDNFYTPDQGYTWICVTTADEHQNFLMNRFLAAVFEYSTEIFYQLIAVPNVTTPTQLEEESYQEKEKRMLAAGFPDREYAWEIHTPLPLPKEQKTIPQKQNFNSEEKYLVASLIDQDQLMPFANLWNKAATPETISTLDEELSLIINSTFIRFKFDLSDKESFDFVNNYVCGTINIALEKFQTLYGLDAQAAYARCNLQVLFRHGLSVLRELHKTVRQLDPQLMIKLEKSDRAAFNTIAGLWEEPVKLATLYDGHSEEELYLFEAFKHCSDIEEVEKKLKNFK